MCRDELRNAETGAVKLLDPQATSILILARKKLTTGVGIEPDAYKS